MVPQATTEHHAALERITDVTFGVVRKAWRRMRGKNWERAWRSDVGPQVVEVVTEAQQTAAAQSQVYTAAVLAELGIDPGSPPALNLPAFSGVAGDGRPVETGLFGAVIKSAKAQYEPRMADLPPNRVEELALDTGLDWMTAYIDTIVADATRAAEAVSMAEREWVEGYVRMLDPKSPCSRCVVLAGKFYLFNEGFDRHEECRCKHIPYAENMPHDLLTNPSDYFHSLSTAEQNRVFTSAGAEAIRMGADIAQVVNARRGMSTAQQQPGGSWIPKGRLTPVDAFGRKVYVTTEGVTKRGVGRKAMGSGRPFRLMPESVLAIADDRADAIKLLKLYGYIT